KKKKQVVMDIGPGCSDLPHMIIELCRKNQHSLILVDSKEMLSNLPDESFITKVPCYYPEECPWIFEKYFNKINVILSYSVLHYIFTEQNLFNFVDMSLSLLADEGEFLIGDIPNVSKRKRFFNSPNGIKYHKLFTGKNEKPDIQYNTSEPGIIDDAIMFSIMMRCRNAGFDSFILPQANDLPMANRREDILIIKP
ncbi:MAG: SAM-dependent methyltransferase, partial [Thermodesulfobacteriota bacterium]|nr:SAM-dependent methyltransferase [Thermodesulfobacteriota bacterium]